MEFLPSVVLDHSSSLNLEAPVNAKSKTKMHLLFWSYPIDYVNFKTKSRIESTT